jgi:hypothetical protein
LIKVFMVVNMVDETHGGRLLTTLIERGLG